MLNTLVREFFPGLFQEDKEHLVMVNQNITGKTLTCTEVCKKNGYTIYNITTVWTKYRHKLIEFALDGDGKMSGGIMWLPKGNNLEQDALWSLFDLNLKVKYSLKGMDSYKEYSRRCYIINNIIYG